mmetsp:Transcript_145376/g.368915  ORF Transcript_145376/g.368915 Transcript_145376/m.368915 type:complete len:146 (-) Transcript_145376:122-559(-)
MKFAQFVMGPAGCGKSTYCAIIQAQSWGAGCTARPPRIPGGGRRRRMVGSGGGLATVGAAAPAAAAAWVSTGSPPPDLGEKAALPRRRPLSPRTTASFSAKSWASARSVLSHGSPTSDGLAADVAIDDASANVAGVAASAVAAAA